MRDVLPLAKRYAKRRSMCEDMLGRTLKASDNLLKVRTRPLRVVRAVRVCPCVDTCAPSSVSTAVSSTWRSPRPF